MFLYIFKIIIRLIMTSSRFDPGSTSVRPQKPWTSSFYGSMNGPDLKTLATIPLIEPYPISHLLISLLITRTFPVFPHSWPPLIILVMPGTRPANVSIRDGVHWPMMTSWLNGLLACGVIQNHMAVLNEITGSVATRFELFIRSTLMALLAKS